MTLARILCASFAFACGATVGQFVVLQLNGALLTLSKVLHDIQWRRSVAHADYCVRCGSPCSRVLVCKNGPVCGWVHHPDEQGEKP